MKEKSRSIKTELFSELFEVLDEILQLTTIEDIKKEVELKRQYYIRRIGNLKKNENYHNSSIGFWTQFLDVLDVINQFNTIEEVKADIVMRKKIYKEYIE